MTWSPHSDSGRSLSGAGASHIAMWVMKWSGAAPCHLVAGVAATFVGMVWLSRVGADSSYLFAVALPMTVIGAGQGLAFAPMTSAGLAGVDGRDAGAASGVVNTAHQLGSALGLGILVAVSTAAAGDQAAASRLLARVTTALTGGSVLLAAALVVVLALIARPHHRTVLVPAEVEDRG